jgi:beta-lactamase superfamily II metal-dependent hydrolase
VGHQNPFRLPHPQVLQRLEAKDCAVYRTDIDGAVEITTDGEEVLVRCGGKLSKRGCNVGG